MIRNSREGINLYLKSSKIVAMIGHNGVGNSS